MASKPVNVLLAAVFLATLLANHEVYCQPTLPTFQYALCQNNLFGNYTANSTYEANLKTVLSDLVEKATMESFYNASSGGEVYGQYNCRGDVSSQFCGVCVQFAAILALNCSNAKASIIWFSECTLRYSNESMYGDGHFSPILSSYSLINISDSAGFSAMLNDTATGLIQEASHGNGSTRYYATDEVTNTTSLETTYFLVQCSPDLSESQCESCLVAAFNKTKRCCGHWPIWIYSFPPSCQVMYDTRGPFYYTTNPEPSAASPPPPISASSQPPPTNQVTVLDSPPSTSTPTSGGSVMARSSERLKLGILCIVLAFAA